MNRTISNPRANPEQTAKIALAVTLASETFFFGTLISAFLFMRGTQPWPNGTWRVPGWLIVSTWSWGRHSPPCRR